MRYFFIINVLCCCTQIVQRGVALHLRPKLCYPALTQALQVKGPEEGVCFMFTCLLVIRYKMQDMYCVVISPSSCMFFLETASNIASQLHGPPKMISQTINLPGLPIFRQGIMDVAYYVVSETRSSIYTHTYTCVIFQVASLAQVLQQLNLQHKVRTLCNIKIVEC